MSPETIATAGVSGWTELPIWVPPNGELAALLELDVTAALSQGLSCRPIAGTVADTWAWLQREGLPTGTHPRAAVGLDEVAEQRILALDHGLNPPPAASGRTPEDPLDVCADSVTLSSQISPISGTLTRHRTIRSARDGAQSRIGA